MAATLSTTMAMLNTKCMTSPKPISLISLQALTTSKPNIFKPTVNQINKMTTKGVIVGLGIGGGLAASSGLFATPDATAAEIAALAEAAAAANDNRGQLLLIVITPAILWVLYNILQPALNQINKMRK